MRNVLLFLNFVVACLLASSAQAEDFQLRKGDHISIIGNTTADRLQHHGWLETYIQALHPDLDLTFRNLAFPGDELKLRPREANFGSPDAWLSKMKTDVVFAFFGYNEALKGPDGLPGFRKDLAEVIDGMRAQKYNGKSAPRIVMFSPITHEDLNSRHLPDGSKNNANLKLYTAAMQEVCDAKDVAFVDLFSATARIYADADQPLTMNGVHLLEHGNKALAAVICKSLFGKAEPANSEPQIAKLRESVLEKNYYWFSRYRVVDGYNVFGGRSKLSWFGQSNADVMMREMEIFDIMTANRDKQVWAIAAGRDLTVTDDNIPDQLVVKTNKRGDLADGAFSYRTAEEGKEKLKMAEGLQANVFASEEMFPELINPVQMAVDTDGRLFVSVWPSYPHWNPTEPRKDRILCLPDDDGDGVADKCIVFADELNSVTGFEFWNGGMLVAALPELWFLKDTDGDNVADVKIRMLQGLSSADSHHSANAMVLGPDGWVYWSRGIFNVATMETPTTTYRSTRTGVHRFNPRTFEMQFHFPIGPNPHGDVFDRWGYQFANDGTSGTGSYVNIGKGRGNKQWFKKRVRPVAANGILSSSHFPDKHQNNFLICNCIGFLGVLQHEVKYNGADITCEEIEPILVSSDPNFRPTDVEIGSDGALYVADWAQALIGHMQHNMRDPNRDHQHGRIYRVTAKGRPLLKPVRLKGKPIIEVLEAFYAKENATRYRARIELSSRDSNEVASTIATWASSKDVSNPDDAQALLECLWVHEEHRLPNRRLIATVMKADEPRVRAAAARTLGHWAGDIEGWEQLLIAAARDESPLVRAEAIKSAVEFQGAAAAEAIFEAASRPTDAELNSVLTYARGTINVDAMLADAVAKGRKLSAAAKAYALQKGSADLLLKLDRSDDVYQALLGRGGIAAKFRREALQALAKSNERSETKELIAWIRLAESNKKDSVGDLARILANMDTAELQGALEGLASLADETKSSAVRTATYAAWIRSGGAEAAWRHASQSRSTLYDLLTAVRSVRRSPDVATLFAKIRPLAFELPEHLQSAKDTAAASDGPAVAFEYYQPNPPNVAQETLDKMKPKMTGRLASFSTFVPKGAKDAFATRQTASIRAPVAGEYTFFTASDDGSRLYINGKEVVNNDGLHGIVERRGSIQLDGGFHEIVVTYFDNGGGDGLRVMWQGPGFAKQPITAAALRPAGSGNIRSLAVETLAIWPGRMDEKIADFSQLIVSDSLTNSALKALASLPPQRVADKLDRESVSKILATLIAIADKATPVQRQSGEFTRLLNLGDNLVAKVSTRGSARKLIDLRASIPMKADPRVMALGKKIFMRDSHCATCHQPHGQGLPNLYPPIDGTLWATGNEDRLIAMVLDGMHGTIEVKGKRYSSPPLPPMTGFRQLLNDEEVAAVLTYVRNTWSNRAKPISPQQVARIRAVDRGDASFWFANDLMKKYPLEDGREPIKSSGDGWIPKFVKKWELGELKTADITSGKRSFETGQVYFNRLGCAQCHKLGDKGGNFGPNLAELETKKRKPEYILQSVLEPSKDVEDKYRTKTFFLSSGKIVTGLVVSEKNGEIHVLTDPLNPNMPTVFKTDDVDEQSVNKNSIMPEGLVNWLNEQEVYDLMAYVLSGGKKDHAIYNR